MNYTAEDREQIAIIDWCCLKPLLAKLILAIPNGGQRHWQVAYKLKKTGVRRGVSDLFLPLVNYDSAGLWIEVKAKGKSGRYGSLTKEQKTWLNRMSYIGYQAEKANGCKQAIELITDYVDNSRWTLYDQIP